MCFGQSIYKLMNGNQTAIIIGLLSIPFTIAANLQSITGTTHGEPLFIACVLSGYIYRSKSISGIKAGILTGLTGGLPILIIWAIQNWLELTTWFEYSTLSTVGAVGFTVTMGIVIIIVLGGVGGYLGQWLGNAIT